jgi:hypothetical protein
VKDVKVQELPEAFCRVTVPADAETEPSTPAAETRASHALRFVNSIIKTPVVSRRHPIDART